MVNPTQKSFSKLVNIAIIGGMLVAFSIGCKNAGDSGSASAAKPKTCAEVKSTLKPTCRAVPTDCNATVGHLSYSLGCKSSGLTYGSYQDFLDETKVFGRRYVQKIVRSNSTGYGGSTWDFTYDPSSLNILTQKLTTTTCGTSCFPTTTRTDTFTAWDSSGRPNATTGQTVVYDENTRTVTFKDAQGKDSLVSIYDECGFEISGSFMGSYDTSVGYKEMCLPEAVLELSQNGIYLWPNASWSFGTAVNIPKVFTITNRGSGKLVIKDISIGISRYSSQFAITQMDTNKTVPPGGTFSFSLSLVPTLVAGYPYAQVYITSNDYSASYQVLGISGRVPLPPGATAISLGLGTLASCAIVSGNVFCWENSPVVNGIVDVPSMTGATQISVGFEHACAIDSGSVKCWGYANYGESNVPVLSSPTQVSAGYYHTCALDSTGVKCWGDNRFGQLNVPELSSPTQISVGGTHSCALDNTGVICWGNNNYGQLNVPALSSPTQVSAGGSHTCALDSTGVKCWGYNLNSQISVPPLTLPTQIAAVNNTSCALTSTGAKCWGYGYTSSGTFYPLSTPTALSVGYNGMCAIDATGLVCSSSSLVP